MFRLECQFLRADHHTRISRAAIPPFPIANQNALKSAMLKSHVPRQAIQNVKSRILCDAPKRYQSTASSSKPNAPQVIFSGIQPTGIPHLGNYLGALQNWVRLQDTAEPSTKLFYSIVDLHAITVPQKKEELRRWKRESLATLLAVGVDPERCTVFWQSSVGSVAFWFLVLWKGSGKGEKRGEEWTRISVR